MLSIITLPEPATFLSDISDWASPLFTDLLPLAVYAVGIMLAFGIVAWIVSVFGGIIQKLTHKE